MTLAAIELDDAAVSLARDGTLVTRSPGFALLDGDRLAVGEHARCRARLEPRLISTRFWERLSDDAVVPARSAGWTHAQLARAHLGQVWSSAGAGVESLILVVPGDYDRRQLGLLLGIAQQLNLPVRGMTDAALAACEERFDRGLIVHVTVSLHRTLITGIECGERARRVFARSLDGHGLVRLYEGWIRLIGELFVKSTRFDPLHRAESEQAIFDRLPQWLELLERREAIGIEMAAGDGRSHAVRLAREQLAACAQPHYEALQALLHECCPGVAFELVLAHGAATLPGLAAALSPATRDAPAHLAPGAGALGALRRARHIIEPDWQNTVTISLPLDSTSRQEPAQASR